MRTRIATAFAVLALASASGLTAVSAQPLQAGAVPSSGDVQIDNLLGLLNSGANDVAQSAIAKVMYIGTARPIISTPQEFVGRVSRCAVAEATGLMGGAKKFHKITWRCGDDANATVFVAFLTTDELFVPGGKGVAVSEFQVRADAPAVQQ